MSDPSPKVTESSKVLYHRPAQREVKISLHNSGGLLLESSGRAVCRTVEDWIDLALSELKPVPPPDTRPVRSQKFVTRRVAINPGVVELAKVVEAATATNDESVQRFAKSGFADVHDIDGYQTFPGAEIVGVTSSTFVRPFSCSWATVEVSVETIVSFKEVRP